MSVTPGLVSTIIPVYNRPVMLREAVDSVLAQSYQAWEIIIVDDGSCDETPSVARGLSERHPRRITLLQQTRSGPGAARERGRAAARGEYVQYLDSDDLLMPRKFELQLRGFERAPKADISYGGTRRYALGTMPDCAMIRHTGTHFATLFPRVLMGRLWATSTPLYRRSVVERAGEWPALMADEDWLHDVRMACAGARLHHLDQHVCDVRDHPGEQLHRQPELRLARYRHMCQARHQMFDLVNEANRALDGAEYRHFRKSTFLLARQCGALGLAAESRALIALLRSDRRGGAGRWQVAAYHGLGCTFGYAALGRACDALDRLRDRRSPRPPGKPPGGVSHGAGGAS